VTRTLNYAEPARVSDQEAFDRVARHLLTQGRRAQYGGATAYSDACRYRAPDGAMCAIGCLIPDEEYDPHIEGKGAGDLIEDWPELRPYLPSLRLAKALQGLHDVCPVERWPEQLRRIADEFGLDAAAIDRKETT
jgi:hypothetical protein